MKTRSLLIFLFLFTCLASACRAEDINISTYTIDPTADFDTLTTTHDSNIATQTGGVFIGPTAGPRVGFGVNNSTQPFMVVGNASITVHTAAFFDNNLRGVTVGSVAQSFAGGVQTNFGSIQAVSGANGMPLIFNATTDPVGIGPGSLPVPGGYALLVAGRGVIGFRRNFGNVGELQLSQNADTNYYANYAP